MFGRYVAVSFEGWSCGLHWDGMAWRHALHHGKQLQVELIIVRLLCNSMNYVSS